MPRSTDELLKQSLLYREFKAQQDEILRHKWLESEKKGRDIGYELAEVDWRMKHCSQWRRERRHNGGPCSFEI